MFLFKEIEDLAKLFEGKVVDIGCGTKPYKMLFNNVTEYIGLDIEISGNGDSKEDIDLFYDGKKIPLESNSVDGFFSSETFEHIFNLEEIIPEIHRALKPNGLLLATCPFMWPEHEIPYDYARYTSFGLKHLLEKNGFEIVKFVKTGNFIVALFQIFALYVYFFTNKIPVISGVLFWVLITPMFLIGKLLNLVLPAIMKRKDLYLNNVVLARKIQNS